MEKKGKKKGVETAIFAMGCFWHVQAVFDRTKKVISTVVGYTGCDGSPETVSYKQVCSGDTGCAEAVEVVFDPKVISYEELLDVFWANHDPTIKDMQGPDVGSQYRSAIFYTSEDQKKKALASREKMQKKLGKGKIIVTEISSAGKFYRAEEYHQKYYDKTGIDACPI